MILDNGEIMLSLLCVECGVFLFCRLCHSLLLLLLIIHSFDHPCRLSIINHYMCHIDLFPINPISDSFR